MPAKQPITIRRARPDDHRILSSICFDAFGTLNARHGFPSDFPVPDIAIGLMGYVLGAQNVYSAVAEQGGTIVGSNFLWEARDVAGIGPITVAPTAQGGVGRALMEDVLTYARTKGIPSVRLVQAAFNTTSMTLYTKLGFDVREPLVCMNGTPPAVRIPGYDVRPATEADTDICADICRRVHGHDRTGDLLGGIHQATASVVEFDGNIVGYTAGVGFMGHTVALENAGLKALIAAAPQIAGPGMLLPSRNGEMFRWCLDHGLKVIQPLTLMSLGLYNEPHGAFMPSILF